MNPESARVEILPVLGRLCFQLEKPTGRSYARAFRLWSLIVQRGRDGDSESCILSESDADLFGISPQTLTRHMEDARQLGFIRAVVRQDDRSWRVFFASQVRVHGMLHSLALAYDLYHVSEIDRVKVLVPLADFANWLTFAGAVFDAWVSIRKHGRKLPGYALSKLWGTTRQQIAKWRKATGRSGAVRNWGAAEPLSLAPDEMPHSFEGTYKGRKYTYYRRSNTFLPSLDRAAKGQARKLRAAWSPAEIVGGGYSEDIQQPIWDTDGPRPVQGTMRRNFEKTQALQRARKGLSDALLYLMVSEIRRWIGWSRMWLETPAAFAESQ